MGTRHSGTLGIVHQRLNYLRYLTDECTDTKVRLRQWHLGPLQYHSKLGHGIPCLPTGYFTKAAVLVPGVLAPEDGGGPGQQRWASSTGQGALQWLMGSVALEAEEPPQVLTLAVGTRRYLGSVPPPVRRLVC